MSDVESRILTAADAMVHGIMGSNSSSTSSPIVVASSSATMSSVAAMRVSAIATSAQVQKRNAEFASLKESSSFAGELPPFTLRSAWMMGTLSGTSAAPASTSLARQ
ncbi:uncharacterized protein LAESUDRAFT_763551 [Laetiporus sulphureus 93-53]|uniref:Uncharacterized protein n=1 Tax=Laetiporus sulphureus 93-53 TaxID=1314785 RepID=A0A165BUN6_9APHY|nr:uncharacterized protein LAESUDRAFT_763551 [Laetiporus sulphureus 93-53]KZT01688.1 hypothetical protein LAESUDRAFT_763551 [Laetiporus sulphureus 93-53]